MPTSFDFKALLVKAELLTVKEADAFAEMARRRNEVLWETLLRENKITEAWLADLFAQRLKIPIVTLSTLKVDPEVAH